jgi:hypothetical protein
LLRAAIDANRLSALRAASNAELPSLDGAAGVTVNPQPGLGYLASSHVGARGPERDSFVAFSSPSSGKLALALPVGLFDVVALAYSPSGNLYAADFAEQAADEGGVFRIDEVLLDNRQACRAVRVARVRHPTSLLFTPDGTLWVTAWEGSEPASADAETPRGVVLKIRGDL